MKKVVIVSGIVAVIGVAVWLAWPTTAPVAAVEREAKEVSRSNPGTVESGLDRQSTDPEKAPGTVVETPKKDDEPSESPTEDEKGEAEREKCVEDFDNLTDKWMEPSSKGASMEDIDRFAKLFRQVPKDRQDECIHRALNLIPDENVMLLAGVLMDKSMDKEIIETVYNDVLNRDELVKKPILLEIFKDKSHPCWADTAWILDVTGELPKKK